MRKIFTTKRLWFKAVASGIVCLFVLNDISSAAQPGITRNSDHTLSPSSKFNPIVRIEKRNGEFVFVENQDEKAKLEPTDTFQEDTGFVYLSLLIAQVMERYGSKISEEGLKMLIMKHLSHIDFTRFKWQELYKEGSSFCLPYARKTPPKVSETDPENNMIIEKEGKQIIYQTRENCDCLGFCEVHSPELLRLLTKKGIKGRVVKDKHVNHFWVETEEYVIDAYPEGAGDNYTELARSLGDETCIFVKKDSELAKRLYRGEEEKEMTMEALKAAENDKAYYRKRVSKISDIMEKGESLFYSYFEKEIAERGDPGFRTYREKLAWHLACAREDLETAIGKERQDLKEIALQARENCAGLGSRRLHSLELLRLLTRKGIAGRIVEHPEGIHAWVETDDFVIDLYPEGMVKERAGVALEPGEERLILVERNSDIANKYYTGRENFLLTMKAKEDAEDDVSFYKGRMHFIFGLIYGKHDSYFKRFDEKSAGVKRNRETKKSIDKIREHLETAEDKLETAVLKELSRIEQVKRPTEVSPPLDKTISGKEIEDIVLLTRSNCDGVGTCRTHSLELLRLLAKKRINGRIMALHHRSHFWVETDEYIIDAYPEGMGKGRTALARLRGDARFMILKKNSLLAKKLYKGEKNTLLTTRAIRWAKNDLENYSWRIKDLSGLLVKRVQSLDFDSIPAGGSEKKLLKEFSGHLEDLTRHLKNTIEKMKTALEQRRAPVLSDGIAGMGKDKLRWIMLQTRENCEGVDVCMGHSVELLRLLTKQGINGRVMNHVSDPHYWVETDKYILDAFPKGMGDERVALAERLGDKRFLIIEKDSGIARRFYRGEEDGSLTSLARRDAEDDVAHYRRRIREISIMISKGARIEFFEVDGVVDESDPAFRKHMQKLRIHRDRLLEGLERAMATRKTLQRKQRLILRFSLKADKPIEPLKQIPIPTGSGEAKVICEVLRDVDDYDDEVYPRPPPAEPEEREREQAIDADGIDPITDLPADPGALAKEPEQPDKKTDLSKEKRLIEFLRVIVVNAPEGLLAKVLYWILAVLHGIRYELHRALLNYAIEELPQKLLFLPKHIQRELEGEDIIWINATGLGEFNLAEPVMRELAERYPGCKIVLSCPYRTGIEQAREKFPDVQVVYTPYDIPLFLNRFFRKVNVRLLIMTERPGGLGLGCLKAVKRDGGKVIMVNGRVPRGVCLMDMAREKAYGAGKDEEFLKTIDLLLAQNREEARGFISQGALDSRTVISGNIKFDTSVITVEREEKQEFLRILGIGEDTPVIIAGSTHPGEHEIMLRAYKRLKERHPDLVLIIAPRQLEYTEAILANARTEFERSFKKTELAENTGARSPPPEVVILDTFGELRTLYGIATVAVVCGSFGPVHAGHSPLEPANLAKPIILGPNMEEFTAIVKMFLDSKGALQVQDEEDLIQSLELLLSNPDLRETYGENAYNILQENRGALKTTIQEIDKIYPSDSIDSAPEKGRVPPGMIGWIWQPLVKHHVISMEGVARWSFFLEEGIFSLFFLEFLPWFLAVTGFLEPTHMIFFYILSNFLYGMLHARLYKWNGDGVEDVGFASLYHKFGFMALGAVFRIGYLIPGLNPGAAMRIALVLHAVYNNLIAPHPRIDLPIGMAGTDSKDDLSGPGNILQEFRNMKRFSWKGTTKEEKRFMVETLADAAGKEAGALTVTAFNEQRPVFGGKSLGGIIAWATRVFHEENKAKALDALKKYLGIEPIYKKIDETEILQLFKEGTVQWKYATKEAKLHMVRTLARARSKEPEELRTTDFFRQIPEFNNKTLGGLSGWAREEFNCTGDAAALIALKKHLGIKAEPAQHMLDETEVIQTFRKRYLSWGVTTKEAKLLMVRELAKALNRSPGALRAVDFYRRISTFNNKTCVPLLSWARKEFGCEGSAEALIRLKEYLGIEEKPRLPQDIDETRVLEAFGKGSLRWDRTTKEAKLYMIESLAKALDKEPGTLNTRDFSKKIPEFGNKALRGLLVWSERKFKCRGEAEAVEKLKQYMGIEEMPQDIDETRVLEAFRKGSLRWDRTTKEAKRYMVEYLAKALGKEPAALHMSDFERKISEFNGKILSGLLAWTRRKFKYRGRAEALKRLKGYLDIEEEYPGMEEGPRPPQDIDETRVLELFKKGYLSWRRTTREAKLYMVERLAEALGKEPGGLTATDFRKRLPLFGGKVIEGLLRWAGRMFKNADLSEALRELKEYLDIEATTFGPGEEPQDIDETKVLQEFIKGDLPWSRTTEEARFYMVECLAKALGKEPGALYTSDFSRKIPEFGGKSLQGFLEWARRTKFKCARNAPALRKLKEHLGIDEIVIDIEDTEVLALFKKGILPWRRTTREAKLYMVNSLAVTLRKDPGELTGSDFLKKIPLFGGKSLGGLLLWTKKNFICSGSAEALRELKAFLGISDLARPRPVLELSYEDWETTKDILRSYPGCDNLPDTMEDILDSGINKEDMNSLAEDTQKGNYASYLILLFLADRLHSYCVKNLSARFNIPMYELLDMPFDYLKTLDTCIARYERSETSFRGYLYKSIFWGLYTHYKREKRLSSIITSAEEEERDRGVVRLDAVSLGQFEEAEQEPGLPVDKEGLPPLLKDLLEGYSVEEIAPIYGITDPDEIRDMEEQIWGRIAETPGLKKIFEDTGFNVDEKTQGKRKAGPPPGMIGWLFQPFIDGGIMTLETATRLSFLFEETIFSVFFLNLIPWFLSLTGGLYIGHMFVLFFVSNFIYGGLHTQLYRWGSDGKIHNTDSAGLLYHLGFMGLGMLFRVGYVIPGASSIGSLVFALVMHALYNNILAWGTGFVAAMIGPGGAGTPLLKDEVLRVLPEEDQKRIDAGARFCDHITNIGQLSAIDLDRLRTRPETFAFDNIPGKDVLELVERTREEGALLRWIDKSWGDRIFEFLDDKHELWKEVRMTPLFGSRIYYEAYKRGLRGAKQFKDLYSTVDELVDFLLFDDDQELSLRIAKTATALEAWGVKNMVSMSQTALDRIALYAQRDDDTETTRTAREFLSHFMDNLFNSAAMGHAFMLNRSIMEGYLYPKYAERKNVGVVYLLSGSAHLYKQALRIAEERGVDASRIHAVYLNRKIARNSPELLREYIKQEGLDKYDELVVVDTGFHGSSARILCDTLSTLPKRPQKIHTKLLYLNTDEEPYAYNNMTVAGFNNVLDLIGPDPWRKPHPDLLFITHLLDKSFPTPFRSPVRLERDPESGRIHPKLVPTELPVFSGIIEDSMKKGTEKFISENILYPEPVNKVWDQWLPDRAAENIRGQYRADFYFTKKTLEHFPEEVLERIRETATWEYFFPDKISGRRSAVLKLTEPVTVRGKKLKAVKVKAVCYRPEEKGEAGRPSLDRYEAPPSHILPTHEIQFEETGFMETPYISPRYRGFQSTEETLNEFNTTFGALQDDMPVNCVMGYGAYDPAHFGRARFGFVILGLEDEEDERFSHNAVDEIADKFEKDRGSVINMIATDVPLGEAQKRTMRETIEEYFRVYGEALRELHDGGYIHGTPHHGNVTVLREGDSHRAVFNDFAHGFIKRELSLNMTLGYQLKDLLTVAFDIKNNLSRGNILGDIHYHCGADYIKAFLEAYFHEFNLDGIGEINYERIQDILDRCGRGVPIQDVRDPISDAVKTILSKQSFHISDVELTFSDIHHQKIFDLGDILMEHKEELEVLKMTGVEKIYVEEADIPRPKLTYNKTGGFLRLILSTETNASQEEQLRTLLNLVNANITGVIGETERKAIGFRSDQIRLGNAFHRSRYLSLVYPVFEESYPILQLFCLGEHLLGLEEAEITQFLDLVKRDLRLDIELFRKTINEYRGFPIHEKFIALLSYVRSDRKNFPTLNSALGSLEKPDDEVAGDLAHIWGELNIVRLEGLMRGGDWKAARRFLNGVKDEGVMHIMMTGHITQQVITTINDPRSHFFYKAMLYSKVNPRERGRVFGPYEDNPEEFKIIKNVAEETGKITQIYRVKRLYLEGMHEEAAGALRTLVAGVKHPNIFMAMLVDFIGVEGVLDLMNILKDVDILWFFQSNFRPLNIPEIPLCMERTMRDERYRQVSDLIAVGIVDEEFRKKYHEFLKEKGFDPGSPPPGSLFGVFAYLCDNEITDPANALTIKEIADGLGLAFSTVENDLRGLYYHLHLVERPKGTRKDIKYYIPGPVRERADRILPVLGQFRGGYFKVAVLKGVYENEIKPLLSDMEPEEGPDEGEEEEGKVGPDEVLRLFQTGRVFWEETTRAARLLMVNKLAEATGKEPGALSVDDFRKEKPAVFKGKTLIGLLEWAKRKFNCKNNTEAVKALKEHLGLEEKKRMTDEDEILQTFKKGNVHWGNTTKEAKLFMVNKLADALDKKPGALTVSDLHGKRPVFGDKGLGGLLDWAVKEFKCKSADEGLRALKKYFDIKEITEDIDETTVLERFKSGRLSWERTTKEARLFMFKELAGHLNTDPWMLTTPDFKRRIPELGNKTLKGLLGWGRKRFECRTDEKALEELKGYLQIKETIKEIINEATALELLKEGKLVWDKVNKGIKLFMFKKLTEHLKKKPRFLVPRDFQRKVPELNNRNFYGLIYWAKREFDRDNDTEGLRVLKGYLEIKDLSLLIDEDDVFRMLNMGLIRWDRTTREAKLLVLNTLAGALDKRPEELTTYDLQRSMPEFGGKSLAGILEWAKKKFKCENYDKALTRLKRYLDTAGKIGMVDETGVLQSFIEVPDFRWSNTTRKAKLSMVNKLAAALGRRPGALFKEDLDRLIPELGNKPLDGLLLWAKKEFECPDKDTALSVLKQYLGIKDDFMGIDKPDVLRLFKTGMIPWSNTTKEAKLHMLQMLAKALGKKPKDLTTPDFLKKIPEFNDKNLGSLLIWSRHRFECSGPVEALKALKKYFGIEEMKTRIDETNVLDLHKAGQISWDRATKKAKLFMVRELAKALEKAPGALTTGDFQKRISGFGNRSLAGLLSWAKKEFGEKEPSLALRALKEYLGIKDLLTSVPETISEKDVLALFKRERLPWVNTTKSAKLFMVKELATALKKDPGALLTSDFRKKPQVFGGKSLSGVLEWAKKRFSCAEKPALKKLKEYLGIAVREKYITRENVLQLIKSGGVKWSKTTQDAMVHILQQLGKALNKKAGELVGADFRKKIPEFNNRNLLGLYTWAKREFGGLDSDETVRRLKEYLGIPDIVPPEPTLTISYEDWEAAKDILRNYEGADDLPDSLDRVLESRVSKEDINLLAADAQRGNSASYFILLGIAERVYRYWMGVFGRRLNISVNILSRMPFDYMDLLDKCILRFDPQGNFLGYINIRIKGGLYDFYERELQLRAIATLGEDGRLAPREVDIDRISLERYEDEDEPYEGSLHGVFGFLRDRGAIGLDKALTADKIAEGMGLSYWTIRDDLSKLYYHLHLLDRDKREGSGKLTKYYIPEFLENAVDNVLPILARFKGKDLHPKPMRLQEVYRKEIDPILKKMPVIEFSVQDWDRTKDILSQYKEAKKLPESMDDLLDVDIAGKDVDSLAMDAQAGNSASLFVLLGLAGRMCSYFTRVWGEDLDIATAVLNKIPYDYMAVVDICLATWAPDRGPFMVYLDKSIKWGLYYFYMSEFEHKLYMPLDTMGRVMHRETGRYSATAAGRKKARTEGPSELPADGSLYGVFTYLCDNGITGPDVAFSGQEIAGLIGRSHETIKYDLRGLYYHLHLIERSKGTGKDAEYFIPESVRNKASEILPILARFKGKDRRPKVAHLKKVYQEEIEPILEPSLVVLKNDKEPKYMVGLSVMNGLELNEQERTKVSESLERWLRYEGWPKAAHHGDIESYIGYLKDNARERLADLYFVLSEDGKETEGYADLEITPFISMMEIAPWNRVKPADGKKYIGVGAELRAFAIRRLMEKYGDRLYDDNHVGKLIALGFREPAALDIFDYREEIDRGTVERYLRGQDMRREEFIREYGFKKTVDEREEPRVDVDREKKGVQDFIDAVIVQVDEAKARGEKIMVGIDTTWIPDTQVSAIQGLLNRLSHLSRKKGLDNLIIIRSKGERLAGVLLKERDKKGIPLSNIVILGGQNVLASKAFDELRKSDKEKKGAFFAEVALPESFPEYSYIRLLDMLTISLKLAFGEPVSLDNPFMDISKLGDRVFRFIPRAEPLEFEELKKIYEGQRQAIVAA